MTKAIFTAKNIISAISDIDIYTSGVFDTDIDRRRYVIIPPLYDLVLFSLTSDHKMLDLTIKPNIQIRYKMCRYRINPKFSNKRI